MQLDLTEIATVGCVVELLMGILLRLRDKPGNGEVINAIFQYKLFKAFWNM